ncbi:MAG: ImmA/IrrE family metallo-endopeptidase [Methanosphaera stadtmanae]|nr:ImmA/IrrE family metallo-endopeptidase [Methanosphaera stadtmanae]
MNNYEINLKAEELRREWGIDNFCPLEITSMAMKNIDNLTIVWFPMDEDLSGCCVKTEKDKIICINSKHSKGRQNFTIAHELYHLFYDKTKDSFICNINPKDENEKIADQFASYLLVPTCALKEYIKKNNIDQWKMSDIIKCEQYFQISHTAMLCKLRREKFITHKEFLKFKQGVKKHATNLGFDTSLYENTKKYYSIGKIIPLSKLAYDENRITGGLYDEILLNVYREDLVYNLDEEEDILV